MHIHLRVPLCNEVGMGRNVSLNRVMAITPGASEGVTYRRQQQL